MLHAMEERNDRSVSGLPEQSEASQQNPVRELSRNSRRNRFDINIIQFPCANANKRELFPIENCKSIRRSRDSKCHRRYVANYSETIPGTSHSQSCCSRTFPDVDYCSVLKFKRINPHTAISSNISDDGDDLEDIVTLQNNTCYMCNGFYAQNHGEAICSICHAFLFPHFAQELPLKSLDEDSDSDSGNDEPQDSQLQLNMCSRKFLREHRRVGYNGDAQTTAPLAIYEDLRNLACDSSSQRRIGLETLPTEVLLIIIRYLDEMSIWSLSQASNRFSVVISQLIPADKWKEYTLQKWQFLNSEISTRNWYCFYSKMIKSSFCFRCIQAMSDHDLYICDDNPWRENRLRTEFRSLHLDPLEGIWATPLDDLKYHWQACIEGPAGSPYEGGKFYLYMQVPYTYPLTPPVVRFITKIFHPNVSRHGDIGIDSIQHNWSLALTVGKVLISIQSLLTDPYCDVCMEPEIGSMYLHNRAEFEEQASIWTWKYAMNELKY